MFCFFWPKANFSLILAVCRKCDAKPLHSLSVVLSSHVNSVLYALVKEIEFIDIED